MIASQDFFYLTIYAFVVDEQECLTPCFQSHHPIRELTIHPIKQAKRAEAGSLSYMIRSPNPLYVVNISKIALDGVQLADITMEMSHN